MEYLDKIFLGDGIAGMKIYPDDSIDMILCDLPYGMTDCAWDNALDFGLLWSQYWRILKDNGAVVLTAAQPFTTDVINSCRRFFRYCWYWQKNMPTGFTFAKYQPMRCIEDVCVFYKKAPTYNPQGIKHLEKPIVTKGKRETDGIYKDSTLGKDSLRYVTGYPRNLLQINCERGLHPTQKPARCLNTSSAHTPMWAIQCLTIAWGAGQPLSPASTPDGITPGLRKMSDIIASLKTGSPNG